MTAVDEPSYEAQYRQATGKVIGRLRAERGWSYREFAERVGTSHTNLYAAERGEATPGLDVLGHIAQVAGLDLAGLLMLVVAEMSGEPRATLLTTTGQLPDRDLVFLSELAEFLLHRRSSS